MKCGFIFPLVPISFAITAINVTLIMRSLISLLNITLLLLAGLYLNGEFYSPIVFPLLLLAVYCWNGWRTFVESRFFELKTCSIFDVCEELARENSNRLINGENTNDMKNSAYTINVMKGTISKPLYRKIREIFLPYDEVLFWFFVRFFLVANLCLFVAVMMLFSQVSGVSVELETISTIAMATMPFILIIFGPNVLQNKKRW